MRRVPIGSTCALIVALLGLGSAALAERSAPGPAESLLLRTGSDALCLWIAGSEQAARRAGTQAVPHDIRRRLAAQFPEELLDRVRYRVGAGGSWSLHSRAFDFGDATAITLRETVVFRRSTGPRNEALWAHELQHVVQFERWGCRGFAEQYLQSWPELEAEARRAEEAARRR